MQGPPFASGLRAPQVRQALAGMEQAAQMIQAQGGALVKNALNGGEVSPDLGARYDIARYTQGCESLLNMIPLPGGGVTKRPGLLFVGNAGEEGRTNILGRLYPWTYSASLAYMLLFQVLEDNATPAMIYYMNRNGVQLPRMTGVTLPYKGRDIFEVCCCQVGKVIYMAHPKYRPGKLVVEVTDSGVPLAQPTPTFRYEELDFSARKQSLGILSIFEEGQRPSGLATHYYLVCGVDDDTGEEYLPCPVPGMGTYAPQSANGYHWVIRIGKTPNCSEHRIYKQRGGEYGFIGRITDGGTEFHDFNYEPDVSDQPPTAQEFFQKEGDYPSIVFMHQQRLGWASTDNDPLTIWMSQTSNFECLNYKTPPNDDDGIEATLASSQANRILWAVSDRSGLALGTEGEEWFLTGADGSSAITPSSLSFQPQTRYGAAANVDPVRAASSLLFVQRGGRLIRDLGYSFAADRYEAQDITLLARHLFRFATVADWCWQQAPSSILWVVLSSGKLIGLTYMPEQEVCAWHRHETAGDFLSCATLQDSQGRSRLWVVVRRRVPQPDGTVRIAHYVEIMDNVFEGYPDAWDAGAARPQPVYADGQARHGYQARCVPCIPEAGATPLRVRKVNGVKVRVINSKPIAARIISQNAPPTDLVPLPFPTATGNATHQGYVARADWSCPIGAGFREGARLELVCDGAGPATILGIALSCEIATENGGQV